MNFLDDFFLTRFDDDFLGLCLMTRGVTDSFKFVV